MSVVNCVIPYFKNFCTSIIFNIVYLSKITQDSKFMINVNTFTNKKIKIHFLIKSIGKLNGKKY